MANTNFTTLIATTLQNFSNKIMDNVTTNNTLLRYLKRADNIKVVGGGRQFVHQLLYAQNSSFAARGKLDTISTPVTDPVTASEWEIKVVSGSIVLPTLDVAMNSGNREKLLDYVAAKKMEAEVSMGEVLGDQLFTAGASVGANDFDSIPKIIADDPSTEATAVGGMTGSANSWWRNYIGSATVSAFNSAQHGINMIDTALNESTFGTQGPKLIITTKKIFTLYMLGLTSNARYTTMESGDSAFRTLMYATLPFVADDNCTTDRLFGIDTDALKLQVLGQGNFKQSPFQWSTTQLAESSLMYLFANVTCGSRRTQFVQTISG